MTGSVIPVSPLEGYTLGADTWDELPSPLAALEERMLLPWIERLHPRRPMDVGCGTGRWSTRLSAIGFDLSAAMLGTAARKPGLAGRLAVADATALPVGTGCADLVLCTLMLGHTRNPEVAMQEFARILEPGGTLLLTDFHPSALAAGWRHRIRRGQQVYEFEEHFYTLDQLRSAVTGVMSCCETIDATMGDPERPLFDSAGRPELFPAACTRPSVLLTRWRRQ